MSRKRLVKDLDPAVTDLHNLVRVKDDVDTVSEARINTVNIIVPFAGIF